jgi:hypothetical protein
VPSGVCVPVWLVWRAGWRRPTAGAYVCGTLCNPYGSLRRAHPPPPPSLLPSFPLGRPRYPPLPQVVTPTALLFSWYTVNFSRFLCLCGGVVRRCVWRLQWPAFITEIFRIMSAFNFNVEITAPECSLRNLTYETKWWTVMQLPVGAGVLFFVIFVINSLVKFFVLGIRQRKRLVSHRNALIGMFLVVFYFLYLYL